MKTKNFKPVKLFGCDLTGYAWGTPPDFRPHRWYAKGLKVVREAFAALPGGPE